MSEVLDRISFDEFSDNLALILERVIHERKSVLVESETGDLIEVKPASATKSRRRVKTQADYEAFLSSFGGWKDVEDEEYDPEKVKAAIQKTKGSWADIDADKFIADLYRAREEGSRPADHPSQE